MKYNQLTILGEVNKNNRWMYEVKCDCGKVEIKRKDWVISGRTTSCKSCASKRTASNYPPPTKRTGCSGLSGTHFLTIKHGASRRKIEFNLTPEFLWKLYIQQNKKCALTNLDIVLENTIKDNNVDWSIVTASVDRIDSSLGYVESNVWWVHKDVNRLKNNYTMKELVNWCKLIVGVHGNPDPSMGNATTVPMKEQRLESAEATNNLSKSAQHPNPIFTDMRIIY